MDLLKSISHPDEIKALVKYKLNGAAATIAKLNYVSIFFIMLDKSFFQERFAKLQWPIPESTTVSENTPQERSLCANYAPSSTTGEKQKWLMKQRKY